jgi:hypothetical protein
LTGLPQLGAIELHRAITKHSSEAFDRDGLFGAFQLAPAYTEAAPVTTEYPSDGNLISSHHSYEPAFYMSPFADWESDHERAPMSHSLTQAISFDEFASLDRSLFDDYLEDSPVTTPRLVIDSPRPVYRHLGSPDTSEDVSKESELMMVKTLRPATDLNDATLQDLHALNGSSEPVLPLLKGALNTHYFLEKISFSQRRMCQEMIHHYSTKVAHMMIPVGLPQKNPWLTIFLPRAIAVDGPSEGRDALLHTLISIAAFNRARLEPSKIYEEAGTSHMQRAIMYLRQALGSYAPMTKHRPEEINILASVLSMTNVEVFRGGQGAWTLHLEGARDFLQSTGGYQDWFKRNSTSAILCQVYDCLDTLRVTRNNGKSLIIDGEQDDGTISGSSVCLSEPSDSSSDGMQSNDDFLRRNNNYSLDITYGVSLPTLNDIKDTNKIARRLHIADASGPLPDDLAADIDRISRSLYRFTDTTDLSELSPLFDADNTFMHLNKLSSIVSQEMMEHHCRAFHYAAILYFNRATYPFRRTRRRDQQWLVGQVFDHLETLGSLNGENGHPVTLWPALVAGCESSNTALRRRVISFFARNHRFGLGNSDVAKKVILEVWRRADRLAAEYEQISINRESPSMGPVDWREVMHDLNADFVLA